MGTAGFIKVMMKRAAVILFLLGQTWCCGATLMLNAEFPDGRAIHYTIPENTSTYYVLERSQDLAGFSAIRMFLGQPAPVLEFTFDLRLQPQCFFRVGELSVFSPRDTDGDGIDDVYELQHPGLLDPLDPTDAWKVSSGSGLSNYAEYLRDRFGDQNGVVNLFSAETSVLVGKAIEVPGVPEVLSRETSVLLGPAIELHSVAEVYSREVSVLVGPAIEVARVPEVYSREVSVEITAGP